jgi:hypothetical protein
MNPNGTRNQSPYVPVRDCGKDDHVFTVLTDLDKIPRLARCSECHREWAFPMVMEVNRLP